MFKQVFLPIIAVMAFIIFVGLLSKGKLQFLQPQPTPQSSLKQIKINGVSLNVEIARSNEERAKGLSNREKLDENSGMIFVFQNNSKPTFWMKDTKISLDLIWIKDNKIIKIDNNVQPEIGKKDSDLKRYVAPSVIDYVLEVNGGWCIKNKIKVGQSLSGLEQL